MKDLAKKIGAPESDIAGVAQEDATWPDSCLGCVKAAESLLAANVSDFGLLFVVGEEAGSAGARAANLIPNRSRYLINGEPTESKLALGNARQMQSLESLLARADVVTLHVPETPQTQGMIGTAELGRYPRTGGVG